MKARSTIPFLRPQSPPSRATQWAAVGGACVRLPISLHSCSVSLLCFSRRRRWRPRQRRLTATERRWCDQWRPVTLTDCAGRVGGGCLTRRESLRTVEKRSSTKGRRQPPRRRSRASAPRAATGRRWGGSHVGDRWRPPLSRIERRPPQTAALVTRPGGRRRTARRRVAWNPGCRLPRRPRADCAAPRACRGRDAAKKGWPRPEPPRAHERDEEAADAGRSAEHLHH